MYNKMLLEGKRISRRIPKSAINRFGNMVTTRKPDDKVLECLLKICLGYNVTLSKEISDALLPMDDNFHVYCQGLLGGMLSE